jgi:hypothetical protein
VVSKLLPQRLFGLGFIKVSRWRTSVAWPQLWMRFDDAGAGRTPRDDEASAPCAGRCDITQSSSCITNTPGARSGADADWFPH